MSYRHKLRAEIRLYADLLLNPTKRLKELGRKGDFDFWAKTYLNRSLESLLNMADLAENEAANEARIKAEDSLSHLVPPSGTLEDKMREVWATSLIPHIVLTQDGNFVAMLRYEGDGVARAVDRDPTKALAAAMQIVEDARANTGTEVVGAGAVDE